MNDEEDKRDAIATRDDIDHDITRVETSAMAVLNRSEVEMQIEAAHRYPRSIGKFLKDATSLATHSPEIAASCIYALPRGLDDAGRPKLVTGPSVRLAEMMASAYGNMHIGARVLDAEAKAVSAQGVAWDIEKNLRVTIEARRRITNKKGHRYNDDMVVVTGNAAASIALRNAILRVVPRAYVDQVLLAARRVAVGDAKSLPEKRAKLLDRFKILGVTIERVLERLGKVAVEDVGLADIELLIGMGTAIKEDASRLEEYFPSAVVTVAKGEPAPGGLEEKLRAKKAPAAKTEPSPPPVAEADAPPPEDWQPDGQEGA
jgi:hypothetical protein